MDTAAAFDELNLDPYASAEEIHAAHKALTRERHHDVTGEDEEMKRLNQARDVALRRTSELASAGKQEMVLRQLLDLQSNQHEREAAQEKGRELVASTATIQVGRLRHLQRRASLFAVLAAIAVGIVALARSAGGVQGPVFNAYVGVLAVLAVLAGLYRTLLSERINQIQLSLRMPARR